MLYRSLKLGTKWPNAFLSALAGALIAGPIFFEYMYSRATALNAGEIPAILTDIVTVQKWLHAAPWYSSIFCWLPITVGIAIVLVLACYSPILRHDSPSRASIERAAIRPNESR